MLPDSKSFAAVAHYTVQLNGVVIGQADRRESSVVVGGLIPDHLYVLTLIAVNAQKLQVWNKPLHVCTLPDSTVENGGKKNPKTECHQMPELQHVGQRRVSIRDGHALIREVSNRSERVGSSAASDSIAETATPETIEFLTKEIDRVRRHLSQVDEQVKAVEREHDTVFTQLQQELESLRKRRKEGDQLRSQAKKRD